MPSSEPSTSGSSAMAGIDRRVDACAFCGIACCSDGRPLLHCSSCDLVAYCGQEHKNFHWKRHKMICKTVQSRPNSISASPLFGEQFVDTGDPDIQIIENPAGGKMPPPSRKRLQEGGLRKPLKDHTKNTLFRTTLQEHLKLLATSGMALNQHQAITLRLKYIAEHVINGLNEYGWVVVDNFLGIAHCRHTFQEIDRLYRRGLFSAGQLMEKKDGSQSQDIRSDEIYWFDSSEDRATDAVTVRLLVSMIDSIIVHFANRIPPYTISGRSRAMIAVYPGNGTRYVKHVDNPVKDGRCITSIYYCNENWHLNEHGGTLRLYPETSSVPMDIDPQGDRLVFFWSDRRNPHEVLPVFRHRYAITIWYFDNAEKIAAIERRKKEAETGQTAVVAQSAGISTAGDEEADETTPPVAKSASLNLRPNGILGTVLAEELATSRTRTVSTEEDSGAEEDEASSTALPDLPSAYREFNRVRVNAGYPPKSHEIAQAGTTAESSTFSDLRDNSITDDENESTTAINTGPEYQI